MILRDCTRRLWRNRTKSLLISGIFASVACFLGAYLAVTDLYVDKLAELHSTIPMQAVISDQHGRANKLDIPKELIDTLTYSGFIKESYLEMQDAVYYIEPFRGMEADLDLRDSIFATNDIARFAPLADGLISVTYASGFSSEAFRGEDLICIVDEGFMTKFDLTYGDEIYLSGVFDFVDLDQNTGIKFMIVGSYKTVRTQLFYGFDERDVIVPLDAFVKHHTNYIAGLSRGGLRYSRARFTLQNTERIDEFKTYLAAVGFGQKQTSSPQATILSFVILDSDLNTAVTPLKRSLSLLRTYFPAFLLTLFCFGTLLPALLQSVRRREFAILRGLGTRRSTIIFGTMAEMSILFTTGIVIGVMLVQLAMPPDARHGYMRQVFLYFILSQSSLAICTYHWSSERILYQLSVRE